MDAWRIFILIGIGLLCVLVCACGQSTKPTITDSRDVDASINALRAEVKTVVAAEVHAALAETHQTTSAPSEQRGFFNFNSTQIVGGVASVAGGSFLLYSMILISRLIDNRQQLAMKQIDDAQEARLGASTDEMFAAMTDVQFRQLEVIERLAMKSEAP